MLGIKTGQRVIELVETDSTNSYAARLMHLEVPEDGTVIMAGFQKAGRGQRGSGWESEPGKNLLISYILYPNFLKIADQFILNQTISLAVHEFIKKSTSASTAIKWPNDIIAGTGKISGILIENSIRSNQIMHSIVGIGININQLIFETYHPPAQSLSMIENRVFSLKSCLTELNTCIDKWYNLLRINNFRKINEDYLNALYLRNIPSRFEHNGQQFTGTIKGITPEGKLHLITEDGTSQLYLTKEIKYLL
ncbi:MAG: biotin--[acetyl-CoA-carboxylase] ligase [Bacteroidetes bacterium]|nr:biotin--[acetyl-CoA-carboxylase] ligase [Bacteroidota bacterium]